MKNHLTAVHGLANDCTICQIPWKKGVDILAHLLDGLSFVPENIKLDPGSYATEEAYRLVTEEGLPFREAYRKVAEQYK